VSLRRDGPELAEPLQQGGLSVGDACQGKVAGVVVGDAGRALPERLDLPLQDVARGT